jgi:hypothetical protein
MNRIKGSREKLHRTKLRPEKQKIDCWQHPDNHADTFERVAGPGRFCYFESAAANDAARTSLEEPIRAILFPILPRQLPRRIIGSSEDAIVAYARLRLKASTANAQTTNVILYSPNRRVCLCDITRTSWGFCIFQSCREL